MSHVRGRFEWAIVSRVIVFCDFDRVLLVSKCLQPLQQFVIVMRQDKTVAARSY